MDINNTILEAIEKEFCSKLEQDSGDGDNKPVSFASISREGSVNTIPELHGRLDPQYTVQHEKPEHRLMVMLKSAGYSNKEIADQMGYSSVQVGYIMKQEWAAKMLLERIHNTGDSAMKILQDAAAEAAQRLVEIARTATNLEVKRKANNDILDRKYGKPNQPHSMTTKAANELTDEELSKHLQSN